jgi:hypothetical protein
VVELQWRGPTGAFPKYAEHIGAARLLERSLKARVA